MRMLSGFIGFLILLIAIVFALSNRDPASISLWPFAAVLTAPLSLFLLMATLAGLALGAGLGWLLMLPHQLAASRLRGDIGALHDKLDRLQQALVPSSAGSVEPPTDAQAMETLQYKTRWSRDL